MDSLKSRHIKEISYLLSLQYPVSTSKISEETGISRSTLKNDLNIISAFLKSKKIILVRKPKVGVYIKGEENIKHALKNELSFLRKKTNLDKDERIVQLLLDCLTNDKIPTIEDWCDKFGTSRPTIVNDLNHVKSWLKEEGLILEGKSGVGYRLIGGEENIRNALVRLIVQAHKEDFKNLIARLRSKEENNTKFFAKSLLGEFNFSKIKEFLNDIETQTNTKLIDKDYVIVALKIAVSIRRVKNKHYLIMNAKKLFNIMQNPTYKTIYKKRLLLEEFYNIKFSPEEIAYITLSFISSRVQEVSLPYNNHNNEDEKYRNYAERIGKIADDVFGLSISNDEEFIHMLELHLKTTLNKIKYGIKIENPLLNEIREEYPLAFNIAERVTVMLGRRMHMEIPETEAGYIAMYIAMAMEKIKHQKKKRKKVAVICAMAVGTSSLLFWRLVNEMPDIDLVQVGSYRDIVEGRIDPDIDLIISTIPLPEMKIPHIVVSPFLNSKERKKIRDILGIAKYKVKYPSPAKVGEILDTKTIFSNIRAEKAKDVISFLGKSLVRNGYVREGFVKAVLQREKKFPTGLNTPIPIALPHVNADFTLKMGFAIATLKNKVMFNQMGKPDKQIGVRIVIIPALTPINEDNAVFYELLQKCKDTKITRKLLNCSTPEEIKESLIKTFIS